MHTVLGLFALLAGCNLELPPPVDCADRQVYYLDEDGDGVGDGTDVYLGCAPPDASWVTVPPADEDTAAPTDTAADDTDTAAPTDTAADDTDTAAPTDTADDDTAARDTDTADTDTAAPTDTAPADTAPPADTSTP